LSKITSPGHSINLPIAKKIFVNKLMVLESHNTDSLASDQLSYAEQLAAKTKSGVFVAIVLHVMHCGPEQSDIA